jgi:hypothetical protein
VATGPMRHAIAGVLALGEAANQRHYFLKA